MPMLHRYEVELDKLPTEILPHSGSITVPDLHGNLLKFVHQLLTFGVVEFKGSLEEQAEAYAALVSWCESHVYLRNVLVSGMQIAEILSNPNADPRQKEAASYDAPMYKDFINAIKPQLRDLWKKVIDLFTSLKVIDDKVMVRLIGDVLCDRGYTDAGMLFFLDWLLSNGVELRILYSNHDMEFVGTYENYFAGNGFNPPEGLPAGNKASFYPLKLLVDEKVIPDKQLGRWISIHQSCLKLLDYQIVDDGIVIMSHAPIEYDCLGFAADYFEVDYKDASPNAIAETIDAINCKFQAIVKEKGLYLGTILSLYGDDEDILREETPYYITHNRVTKDGPVVRPHEKNGFKVYYAHGHDFYDITEEEEAYIFRLNSFVGFGGSMEQDRRYKADSERNIKENTPAKQGISDEVFLGNLKECVLSLPYQRVLRPEVSVGKFGVFGAAGSDKKEDAVPPGLVL